jgi:hypothetical protein
MDPQRLQTPVSAGPVDRVCLFMRASRVTAAVVLLAVASSGCWSNEDLLFPSNLDAETVHLKIPGVEFLEDRGAALTQGLNDPCAVDPNAITCLTRGVAGMFNTITFRLIAMVNWVMQQRPSKTRAGIRVWGPYYEAVKNRTVRFEMRRDDTVGAGGFLFCVHLQGGRHDGLLVDRNVTCGGDADGFVEVFSGNLVPGDPAHPHDLGVSRGVMDLNLSKQRAAGLADNPTDQGRFKFTYDTSAGQKAIAINISDVVNNTTGLPSSAEYAYQRRAEGEGTMSLSLHRVDDLDQLDLLARWNTEGATRVDAKGTNFGTTTQTWRAWECSNSNLDFVTRHYEWDPARDLPAGAPSETLCPSALPEKPAGW